MKFLKLCSVLLLTVFLAGSAQAYYMEGGDATDKTSADVILDIAFAIDTSASMNDEATGISNAMDNLVSDLSCPDCNVWIQATFYGINGTYYGHFDQVLNGTYVNHDEDNAPAVNDLLSATYYHGNNYNGWIKGGATADQDYYKAIVTIGDEGTENGHPTDAADWAAADSANQAAIDNDVMIFSVVGTPWPSYAGDKDNRDAVFRAMAVGGSGYGYTLGDTGGTFVSTTSNTIEADLEDIICTAAGGGTTVPEPGTMVLFGIGLLGFAKLGRKKK